MLAKYKLLYLKFEEVLFLKTYQALQLFVRTDKLLSQIHFVGEIVSANVMVSHVDWNVAGGPGKDIALYVR